MSVCCSCYQWQKEYGNSVAYIFSHAQSASRHTFWSITFPQLRQLSSDITKCKQIFHSLHPLLIDESAILLYNINIKIKDMSLYLIIWMGRDVLQTEPMGLSAVRSWYKAVQLTFFMLEYVFPIAYSRDRSNRALRLWTLEQILLISRPIHHRLLR